MTHEAVVRELVQLTAGYAWPPTHNKLAACLTSGVYTTAHVRALHAYDSIGPAAKGRLAPQTKQRIGELLQWLDDHRPS
jgi:hypothetical protein